MPYCLSIQRDLIRIEELILGFFLIRLKKIEGVDERKHLYSRDRKGIWGWMKRLLKTPTQPTQPS